MTETTQPDTQVVAWMREYLQDSPDHDYIDATNAYFIAHPYDMTKDPPGMRIAYEAARKPLTVADIPAGQGAASLFLRRDPVGGEMDLCFKHDDGRDVVIGITLDQLSGATTAALTEHLAATLPTVTTEEEA
jgi:hypothetical protein